MFNLTKLTKSCMFILGTLTVSSLTACGGGGGSSDSGQSQPAVSTGTAAPASNTTTGSTTTGTTTDTSSGTTDSGSSGSSAPSGTFDERTLVSHLVDNVIEPAYRRFHDSADAQAVAVADYCSGLDEANGAVLKTAAQTAWRSAMADWQKVEMLQFTPLTDNESNLRNAIYSWPLQSSCAVDQDTLRAMDDDSFDISSRQVQRKGLDALEHLLFTQSFEHGCSTGIGVENWASLTEQEITAARCSYATLAANDIAASADTLVASWSADSITDNGKYLKAVGDGQVHDALNSITDTLFYFDTNTKSDKVAVPLGVKLNNCGDGLVCPNDLESRLSGNSFANILNNIEMLKEMFLGGTADDALGFDDYLVEVGEQETSTKMVDAIDLTISNVESFDVSLEEALLDADKKAEVETLHTNMQQVSSIMKTEFLEKLNLELPTTAAGDGD